MKIFDLPCFDTRKSFYGKAKVMESDNGEKVLISYNTEVAKITESGEVVRLWDGISQTTNRHFTTCRRCVSVVWRCAKYDLYSFSK